MNISDRFAVAIHILSVLEMNKAGVSTSDYIAESVNTNPVVIRRIVGMLSKAGLVEVKPGVAGAKLAKHPSEITRWIFIMPYMSCRRIPCLAFMRIRTKMSCWQTYSNGDCPGFSAAQKAMENTPHEVNLEEIVRKIYSSANGTSSE